MDDPWQKERSLMDELNKTRLAAERETSAVRLLMQVTESVGRRWFGYPWTERIITYQSCVALTRSMHISCRQQNVYYSFARIAKQRKRKSSAKESNKQSIRKIIAGLLALQMQSVASKQLS